MDDKGRIIDKKGAGEFLQNKFYYDEINAKDPKALAAGTVRTEGTVVTSNGTRSEEHTSELQSHYSIS